MIKEPYDTIIIRIRDLGQPYGAGQGVKFSGDDLPASDPAHVSALDKLATLLVATMDDSGLI
jgi:hypothetical protein